MTSPDPHAEQRERNAEMRDHAEVAVAEYERRAGALAEAQHAAAEITGWASDGDNLVTVTVNATGLVIDATMQPDALRRARPEDLPAAFVSAAQSAAGYARAGVEEIMAPLTADVSELDGLFPDLPNISDLMPTMPEPPAKPGRSDDGSYLRSVSDPR